MQGVELILILLAAAVVLARVAKQWAIPHPALLVLGGLVLALIPGLPHVQLSPDVVFLVFVPPLLYYAALTSSYRDFQRNLRSITMLGVGLVLVTMVVVAAVAHHVAPELTWPAAFVLGAIISPPDAVAAIAMTRGLSIPQRIVTILEGESLVNDATALVAYRMAVAAVVAGTFSLQDGVIRFVVIVIGGIVVGLAVGWLVAAFRRLVGGDPVVDNTISLLTPFLAYLPADRLGVSGVLAVVTTGLYLGRRGPRLISAETRIQGQDMWAVVSFLLESLIFILIGLDLPFVLRALRVHSFPTLMGYATAVSLTAILVRLAWVFPASYLPRLLTGWLSRQRPEYPPWRHVAFVGWAGLRGGDSLVIALALPFVAAHGQPFPGRDLIIFLTFSVIFVTLVLQGLTFRPLLHILGLHEDDDTDDDEEQQARLQVAQAGLKRLDALKARDAVPDDVIQILREWHTRRLHRYNDATREPERDSDARRAAHQRAARSEMIDAERTEVIRLRDEERISDDVMRRIQHELDLEEILLDAREENEDVGEGEDNVGDEN